jgi:hypothetical protein
MLNNSYIGKIINCCEKRLCCMAILKDVGSRMKDGGGIREQGIGSNKMLTHLPYREQVTPVFIRS